MILRRTWRNIKEDTVNFTTTLLDVNFYEYIINLMVTVFLKYFT